MRTQEQILVDALTRELARTQRLADKAKAAADECSAAPGKLIAVNREFVEIVHSRATGPKVLKRLEELKQCDTLARRAMARDFVKLLDAQFHAEHDRDQVARALEHARLRSAFSGRPLKGAAA